MRIGHAIAIPTRRGGTFSPLDITGLTAWWRADLGITLNGGTVSAWADQSGNGNHLIQGTGSAQPTYNASGGANNQAFLAFDGGDILARAAAVIGVSTYTYFLVLRQTTGSTLQRLMCCGGGGSGVGMYMTAANNRGLVNHGVAVQDDAAYTLNTDEVWTADRDGTTTRFFVNGTQTAIGNSGSIPTAPAALTEIGGASATGEYIGRIYEGFYYNRLLNTAERGIAVAALRGRYAI